MAIEKVEAQRHVCDSCGKVDYSAEGDPINGISLEWTEVSNTGAIGGAIWACRTTCAVRALRDRYDLLEAARGSG